MTDIKKRVKHRVEALFYAIHLSEIPAQYRGLKLLGRGATSLVFEKDADTVLLFTRDSMKADWLTRTWGLELGKYVDEIMGNRIKSPIMRELGIQIIEMPRLYKLNSHNKTIVNKELVQFYDVGSRITSRNGFKKKGVDISNQDIWKYYTDKLPDSILVPAIAFGANYKGEDFHWDFGLANFMQTSSGDIVITDPIISKDIMAYVQQRK